MAYGAILGQTTTGSGTGQPPATGDVFGQYIGKTYTGSFYQIDIDVSQAGSVRGFKKICNNLTITITNYNGWWASVLSVSSATTLTYGTGSWVFIDSTSDKLTIDFASDTNTNHVFQNFNIAPGQNTSSYSYYYEPHNSNLFMMNGTLLMERDGWNNSSYLLTRFSPIVDIRPIVGGVSRYYRMFGGQNWEGQSIAKTDPIPKCTYYYGGSGMIIPIKNSTDFS